MLFRNLNFAVTIFVLLSSLVEAGDNVRCREHERRALTEFKANAVDDYGILSSWSTSKEADCCSWKGIRCSNLTGHVTLLNLPGPHKNLTGHVTLLNLPGLHDNVTYPISVVGLRGKVSASLSELKYLKYLNLSHNEFNCEIPPQLWNLAKLRYLDLGSNHFYGKIPHRLGNLTNLRYLDLGGSGFDGKILPLLGNLTNLRYLNLSRNHFDGKIPHQLGNLTNLRYLDLGGNNFYGEIPHQLGNLTDLRTLELGFSSVYGNLVVQNLEWVSHFHLLTHLGLSSVNLSSCNDWLNQIYKLSSLTHLFLSSCNLPDFDPSFPLNSTSSALKSLLVVSLSDNNFVSSRSYSRLFNFTASLVYLDLAGTSLSIIPEAFGKMIFLESLHLSACRLEGMIPDSFRNLSHLTTLDLRQNNLHGSLSEFFLPLANNESSLQVLDLSMNQLSGSVPDYIARFTSLRDMSIISNNLSGPFPDNFSQLSSSLVHLDLSYNQITGPFPNLTLFSSLETLNLGNNKLEGTVPQSYFSNLSKLSSLDLSYNSLSFNFSFDWFPPFELNEIVVINCTLGPHFPNWIKFQHKLSILDMSHARISGSIPVWFWDISAELRDLKISNNQIKGTIPDLSLKFPQISWIDLSNNLLQGSVPQFPESLEVLDLSHNMFTGSLSFLCTNPHLLYLDLSNNKLSGKLQLSADCLMNVILDTLNLANNDFYGDIPSFVLLRSLQLRNNSFSGRLPLSLMNTNLELLDLSKNKLTGEVPIWIGLHLTSLKILSLRNNEFSGSIPPQICYLRDAQVLDLSRNRLTGSIPHCINNITSLVEEETDEVYPDGYAEYWFKTIKYVNVLLQWKGVAAEYGRTLNYLKLIDLSSNSLIGEIPTEFASLKELISLNLSSNNLTGPIFPKINQMKNLENLDLSINHLSGEIPSGLASLTLLAVLDLSNNNLRGEIPISTQLQSFDPSKYAGNELCGLPLSIMCGSAPSLPAGHNDQNRNEEHDDGFPKVWLYTSIVLGFITGFWGLIGPITFRRTWRQSYYKLLGDITDWICVTAVLHMTSLQRKFHG